MDKRFHCFKLLLQAILISLATVVFTVMLVNFAVIMTRTCDPDYSICEQAKFS